MIPGRQTRLTTDVVASADSIIVKTDVVRVTGSTTINTITAPLMLDRDGVFLVLIPVDGSVALGTGGNILIGITAVINRAVFLVYSATTGKWYINSGV
jgi:hypothetical protein